MKVALCFSGGIRNLIDNIESIKRCLIEPLNADVFIHGWYFKLDELDNTHKMYRKKETDENKVLLLLKPKKYIFEIYDKNKEIEMNKRFKFNEIKQKYKGDDYLCQLYPNTCGMYYSIYHSNQLKIDYENENDFIYDIVIRCRPDFEYYTPLNMNVLKLVKENNILLPLDNYAFVTQQCDKFAIGSSQTMDKYSNLINHILEYEKKYPKEFWDGPNVLKKHFNELNINTNWIYFDYEYHIRRKSQRLTEDKRLKIDYNCQNLLITKPTKYNNI
jgi:hypothetical protein